MVEMTVLMSTIFESSVERRCGRVIWLILNSRIHEKEVADEVMARY